MLNNIWHFRASIVEKQVVWALPILLLLLTPPVTVYAQEKAASDDTPQGTTQSRTGFSYSVKFLCGPSSERFQEGMVTGFALTAINILNPSERAPVKFVKQVSRALPYQAAGPISAVKKDSIGPLEAIEVECNEIRQMLPSQMTEEFRTGFLILHTEAALDVTVVYSARPRDGEISSLTVRQIEGREIMGGGIPSGQPDLTVTDINMNELRVNCPQDGGSCVTTVPVTIANIGTENAGAFRTRVTLDPLQSVIINGNFPSLAVGASTTFSVQTPPGGNCFDPDCQICAVVDNDNAVTETNEGNNTLCRERQG